MAPAGEPSLDPDRIRAMGFSTAFRGYDQHEVRRYLERLAEALRSRGAHGHRSVGPAGQREAGDVLAAARREAEQALVTARTEATQARAAAQDEAAQLVAEGRDEAERVVAEARDEAERLLATARDEAERVVATARDEAARLDAEARQHAGRTTAEAGPDAQRTVVEASGGRPPVVATARRAQDGARGDGYDPGPDEAAPGEALPRPLPPDEAAALDELFAKVRHSRSQAVADARRVLAGDDLATGTGARGAAGGDADVLSDLERDAVRRFKRAMADDQGELLDAISGAGGLSVERVTPLEERRRRYRDVASAAIDGVARAQAGTGSGEAVRTGAGPLATSLGDRVADVLHGGIERAVAQATSGAGAEAVVERIRAHYRHVRLVELGPLVREALDQARAVGGAGTTDREQRTVSAGSPDQEVQPP